MAEYRVGPFRLRSTRLVLASDGTAVAAGPKVVETLLALAERPGSVATKDALIERIWRGEPAEEGSLAQNVYVLRRIFRQHGVVDSIETVPGAGYRLNLPVECVDDGDGSERERPRRTARYWPIAAMAIVSLAIFLPAFLAGRNPGADSHVGLGLSDKGARLYVMGRYYWNLRSSDGVRTAMTYFTQVIDRDPASPLGYVGMADANVSMADYCYGTHRPSDYFARARAYVTQALLLDSRSAPAHATLGFLFLHEDRQAAAFGELQRSLATDPAYAPAHEWYGIALAREHRTADALREVRRALELQPLSVSALAWLARLSNRPWFATPSHGRRHPAWASIESSGGARSMPAITRRANERGSNRLANGGDQMRENGDGNGRRSGKNEVD